MPPCSPTYANVPDAGSLLRTATTLPWRPAVSNGCLQARTSISSMFQTPVSEECRQAWPRTRVQRHLGALRVAHAITIAPATADPSNVSWQRDLTISHRKMGEVLMARHEAEGALAQYREGFRITESMAKAIQ